MFTIGVTGTKGKSTTSSLIYKIIEDQKKDALLLGNIGIPVFDYIDTIKEDIILVLEMSSHQLEYMKLSPNIAILLNIYEEHLDHYSSLDKYIEAKCNIYRFQNENDYFLYNFDNELLSMAINKYKINTIVWAHCYIDSQEIKFINHNNFVKRVVFVGKEQAGRREK